MRIGPIEAVKSHLPEHFVDAPALRAQKAAGFQAKCDILSHGSPRIERRILKHQDARGTRSLDLRPRP